MIDALLLSVVVWCLLMLFDVAGMRCLPFVVVLVLVVVCGGLLLVVECRIVSLFVVVVCCCGVSCSVCRVLTAVVHCCLMVCGAWVLVVRWLVFVVRCGCLLAVVCGCSSLRLFVVVIVCW